MRGLLPRVRTGTKAALALRNTTQGPHRSNVAIKVSHRSTYGAGAVPVQCSCKQVRAIAVEKVTHPQVRAMHNCEHV